MTPALSTTIVQYMMIGGIALLPSVLWGVFFLRQSKVSVRQMIFSFISGGLSVLPMLIWQKNWNISLHFAGINIPHINLYQSIKVLVGNSGSSLPTFVGTVLIVGVFMFICAGLISFAGNLVLRIPFRAAVKNVLNKTLEEPFLFFILGLSVALIVTLLSRVFPGLFGAHGTLNALYISFWASIMIGYMEEYSKHLSMRFQSDHAIVNIDHAIQYAIAVALGFAFVENIIYFLDRIWLAQCTSAEISNKECLYDQASGIYIHQVGVILIPYIFRSLLSTVAHVVFSGIFGYYFGLARFAGHELREGKINPYLKSLYRMLGVRKTLAYREIKIFQGLMIAMTVHGLFDFVLDQEWTAATIPILFAGVGFLLHLLQKKENQKELLLVIDEHIAERPDFIETMGKIEMMEKIEESYSKHMEVKKDPLQVIDENTKLLEKYEQMWKKQTPS